jgi:16S rRNA (adenine1518-N6/adenine1519-N6)-dimethyltransferase
VVRAKKHLGQHFLKDASIADRIVDSLLEKDSQSPVVEIGPGTGVLTGRLLQLKEFYALDVDEESITYLQQKYPAHADRFLLEDFLEKRMSDIVTPPYNIIGNFPYNISSQIMFRVLDEKDNVKYVVGMFQKEVAERIAEKPGTKTYGILSVLLQSFFEIEYLFTVNENVFDPPPKVKSGVIRLTRIQGLIPECDPRLFKTVVKTAFNQRRKQMRNSVAGLIDTRSIDHRFFTMRPEQLSPADFAELTNFIEANRKDP